MGNEQNKTEEPKKAVEQSETMLNDMADILDVDLNDYPTDEDWANG